MSELSGADPRIQVVTEANRSGLEHDDLTVLHVLREPLRSERPVVRFETRSPRRSLLLL